MSSATFQSRHYLTGSALVAGSLFYLEPLYTIHRSFTLTTIFTFSIICVFRVIYWLVLYPTYFTPFKSLPTPKARYLLSGNEPALFKYPTGTQARLLSESVPNDGMIRLYTVFSTERILVTDPVAISEILVRRADDFQNPKIVKFFWSVATGGGLEALEGDVHKEKRKQLQPAFSHRHIKNLYPKFWDKGLTMVREIKKQNQMLPGSSYVINAREWTRRATIDIVGYAGFGYDFGALETPDSSLVKDYRKLSREFDASTKTIWCLSNFMPVDLIKKIPSKTISEMIEARERVRDKVREVVQEKIKKFEKNEVHGIDMISAALDSSNITEDDLVSHMMTFLAAGHETTSSTLNWAIYLLCKLPHIQVRLRQEVQDLLKTGTNNDISQVSAESLESLPYLGAVCSELLRYYPAASVQLRQAVRDSSVKGMRIPAGTMMLLSSHVTNRDKMLWGPNANSFDPERWMVEGQANNGGAKNAFANLTFGHGPKVCIGAGFARAEILCLLAALVSSFEMELANPDEEVRQTIGIVTGPRGGVDVRIRMVA